jgi:phenylalanyl-tRNA synthetase alpha chain
LDLQSIEREALEELDRSESLAEIESLHAKFLGRKDGHLTQILRTLGELSPDEKKRVGQAANMLRTQLEDKISSKQKLLQGKQLESKLQGERIDLSLPGASVERGHSHPILQAIREIGDIFASLGFESVEERDIETDFYNFNALNIPENHPARDMHDTFYLSGKDNLLLRTHTSSVQIRLMKEMQPPIRIIAPGRVYRHEAIDATHAAIFHQVEGLAVDKKISFADLKGTLKHFAQKFFGEGLQVRFFPTYFPFVEPGAQMDVQCFLCRGKTKPCHLCKSSGWIEIMGAGLVHPNVFKAVGYDPAKVSGFAFGMGVERLVMVRSGIRDIRSFLESDMRFLEQFS